MYIYKNVIVLSMLTLMLSSAYLKPAEENGSSPPVTKFYIEMPEGQLTLHPPTVIEATEEEIKVGNYKQTILNIISPADFKNNWPELLKDPFMECAGPSRTLERTEYIALKKFLILLNFSLQSSL